MTYFFAVETKIEFTPFVLPLHECSVEKLNAQQVDQKIKDRTITCMNQIIAKMGDALKPNLVLCMKSFLESFRNENKQISAVKALSMIAASPLRVDLISILGEVIPVLGSLLRKNQRLLKVNTLSLLDTLVNKYHANMNPSMLQTAICGTPLLISEIDLHTTKMTLILLTSVAKKHPQAMIALYEEILMELMPLVRSSLLKGAALECVINLFDVLVKAELPGLGYGQPLGKNSERT